MIILGIESSCDETAAAVAANNTVWSNPVANQTVHEKYGGVVPELASRAHQKNIVPVVDAALKSAGIMKEELNAVAFTNGPGLIGSLMVGTSFAKAFALALNIPIITVNHLHAHVLALFAQRKNESKEVPGFPFLCLTVSGGHTQIVLVKDYFEMEIIGQTLDDAAGEAFDKIAKILQLPFPGGPLIDKLAREGNPKAFKFPHPVMHKYDYSFSGIKTSVLYYVRREMQRDPSFIENNLADLCASVQQTIIQVLMKKLLIASEDTGIRQIGVAGGVSANSGLRNALMKAGEENKWKVYIPPIEFCTDNAGMIAVTGYYKYKAKIFESHTVAPFARFSGF